MSEPEDLAEIQHQILSTPEQPMTLYREQTLAEQKALVDEYGWDVPQHAIPPSLVLLSGRLMVEVEPTGQVYFHEGKLKPMTFDEAEGYYDCYRRKEVGTP